ncbi:MAG: T9SS type A sorting domain-containing protein [Chitinophagales bacterium]|nr:T9SS type A sorting domain-containing protein [Chitinophagales bacterium]
MKRPNYTHFKGLNDVADFLRAKTRAFSILITLTLLHSFSLSAQVDCNIILACSGGVQISLENNCSVMINPDMVMETLAYDESAYDVTAKVVNGPELPVVITGVDADGRSIKRVVATVDHINKKLEVTVALRGCGNKCWGYATIEDKLAPIAILTPCEERITRFSGNVNDANNTYDRPALVTGCPGGSTANVYYEVHHFAVDQSGIVDINLLNPNLRFSVYEYGFNPSSPCVNIAATGVNTFSDHLTAGNDYFIVVSTVGAGVPPGGIDYTVLIDSRVGNIKSSPSATICTFNCNDEDRILAETVTTATNPVRFFDACSSSTVKKRDEVINLSCGDRFSRIIKRYWTATDASGNVSQEVIQYFYFLRPSLADIVCPADWIVDCRTPFAKLPNGAPVPEVSGYPENIECNNIQLYYEDVVFDLCGAGIKVFRKWTILDWCTGEDRTCDQMIKIEDNIAPIITCPADITGQPSGVNLADIVSVPAGSCTASWKVKPPVVISDCSGVTWDVYFMLADNNGNPPVGGSWVKQDGATRIVGTKPAFASTISSTARPFEITNLPLGRTWLKYTVTDECGNATDCFTEVDVVDLIPPTAICEGHTVVSIDDSGWADLFAQSLDDHSIDNCGPIAKFEVRRKTTTCPGYESDLVFGPKIHFCCGDITNPDSYVTVILRVYDQSGNFNECETQVKVQNKRPSVLTCPADKTLTCGDSRIDAWVSGTSRFDTLFFGVPTTSGICASGAFASRIISNTLDSKCKTGVVTREWYLLSDPSVKCLQRLTIVSPSFSEADITFPSDKTLATCNLADATPDALNSKPTVKNPGCRDIGVSFKDQYFYNIDNICIKILRTWTITDWCNYPNGQYLAERIQVIKLTGSGGAVFKDCKDQTYETVPGVCDMELTITANAEDGCTSAADLRYSWTVDLDKDGSSDLSGTGKSFTRILPVGKHRVKFTVVNRCGVPTTCEFDVTITSTKKPTPVCYREVVWVMDSDGSTEVWASDFDLKSYANCTTDNLTFAFDEAGLESGKRFTCADIPNGQAERIPLRMYVFDASGNYDFCEVILILQDSPLTNACPDQADLLPGISGRIITEALEPVEGAEVKLENITNATKFSDTTSEDGFYQFSGLNVFDFKEVFADLDENPINGVSTLDLVQIQRHILGLEYLDSPYKVLAADINNSKSVTSSDLVNLRKLILGITEEFENNTSWRFVPESYVFADPTYPYDYQERILIDSIYEDVKDVNFIAIKVGDVNNSAEVNARSNKTEVRRSNALFVIEDKAFEAGKTVQVDIKAGELMDIIGAQFTLKFDPEVMEYSSLKSGDIMVKSYNANLNMVSEGRIPFSIDVPDGIMLSPDDVLFSIEFVAKASGSTEKMGIARDGLSPEVYDLNSNIRTLDIRVRNGEVGTYQNILYQNQPNPFKDHTSIAFELANAGTGVLKVMDMTGKQVFTTQREFVKGYNTITIENAQLNGAGIYYYQLETGDFLATKKMILIE